MYKIEIEIEVNSKQENLQGGFLKYFYLTIIYYNV